MDADSPIELIIAPRRRRIGDDEIDRLLPFRRRRTVGPFIYADLIGPDPLPPGTGIDVPVHPHIGLATVTYLFDGALVHRDSTGAVQRIEPGGVNWMTAGRAVSHSERSPDDTRAEASSIAGLQTWVALPEEAEQVEPSFTHLPADAVPRWTDGVVHARLVAGAFGEHRSPVPAYSPMFFVDAVFSGIGSWTLPVELGERGVIVVDGAIMVGGERVPVRHLAVVGEGAVATVESDGPARVIAIGGASVGRRQISWNFVSSDPDRIAWARDAWRSEDWPMVAGDDELVPLP